MGSSNTKQENILINSKTLDRIYAENKAVIMNKARDDIIHNLYKIDIKQEIIKQAKSGKRTYIFFPKKFVNWTTDNLRECLFFPKDSCIDSMERNEIIEFNSNVLQSEFEIYKMFIKNNHYIDIELTFSPNVTNEKGQTLVGCYIATW